MKHAMLILLLTMLVAGCGQGKPGHFAGNGYHVRGKVVWFLPDWTSEAFQVAGADAGSFMYPLPNSHDSFIAKDKAHVYWHGQVIPGADSSTFQMLAAPYCRDAKFVYFDKYVVCDDPEHFEQISPLYGKNSRVVFLLSPLDRPLADRVISRDPTGFRLLEQDGPMFFADGNELIVAGTRYPDVKAADFKYLGDSYWRAGDRAFYFDDEMPEGTLAAKLETLTGQYARDGQRVYYLGRVLEGADPATFTVTDPRWPRARDAKRDYDQGKAVERTP